MLKRKEKQMILKIIEKNIENTEKKIKEFSRENLVLHEENKYLISETKKNKYLINSIIRELYSNLKTDKQKIVKLKELISDCQL